VLAGTARLLLVVAGGAAVVALAGPLGAIFAVIACGIALFGALIMTAVYRASWGA
jgi:hypothetical protein